MTSYTLGAEKVAMSDDVGHAGRLPDPSLVPPDETNT
jgi:hypothetical protein